MGKSHKYKLLGSLILDQGNVHYISNWSVLLVAIAKTTEDVQRKSAFPDVTLKMASIIC